MMSATRLYGQDNRNNGARRRTILYMYTPPFHSDRNPERIFHLSFALQPDLFTLLLPVLSVYVNWQQLRQSEHSFPPKRVATSSKFALFS